MTSFTRDPNSDATSPRSDRSAQSVTSPSIARSHLHAWNPPSTSGRYRWNRLLLGCLCLGLLAGFAKLLQSPYDRDAIHVMVLAPRYRIPIDRDQAPSMDQAHLWASRNGEYLRSHATQAGILLEDKTRVDQQEIHLTSDLRGRTFSQASTLVVYVCGVLAIDDASPALCETSRDAMHQGPRLPMLSLLEQLDQTRCKRIVLYVDAVAPHSSGPAGIAVPWIVEEFQEALERKLVQLQGTPLSVRIAFHDDATPTRPLHSASANWLQSCIQKLQSTRQLDLHEFQWIPQGPISASSPEHELSSNLLVLTSPHWEPPQGIVRLGRRPTTESSESIDSTQPPKPTSDHDPFEIVESGTTQEVLSTLFTILERWKQKPQGIALPALYLDAPMTLRDRCPVALEALEHHYVDWQQSLENGDSVRDDRPLRRLVASMLKLEQGEAIDPQLSPWQHDALKCLQPRSLPDVQSWTAEAVFQSYRVLPLPPQSAPTHLANFLQQLDNAQNSVDFQNYLRSMENAKTNSEEIQWASRIVTTPRLDWALQRELIRNRLLSSRCAWDPATWESHRSLFEQAELARLEAERAAMDQSHVDWHAESLRQAQRSSLLFRESLAIMGSNLQMRHEVDSVLIQVLRGSRWASSTAPTTLRIRELLRQLASVSSRPNTLRAATKQHVPTRFVSSLSSWSPSTFEGTHSPGPITSAGEEPATPTEFPDGIDLYVATWSQIASQLADDPSTSFVDSIRQQQILLSENQTPLDQKLQILANAERDFQATVETWTHRVATPSEAFPSNALLWTILANSHHAKLTDLLRALASQPDRWERIIEWNLQQIERQKVDATSEEARSLTQREQHYASWLSKERTNSLDTDPNTFTLSVADHVDLLGQLNAKIPVVIEGRDLASSTANWNVRLEFDDSCLRITHDGVALRPGVAHAFALPPVTKGKAVLWLEAHRIHSGTDRPASSNIAHAEIHVEHASMRRRTILRFDAPNAPFAAVYATGFSLDNAQSIPSTKETANLQTVAFLPNQEEAMQLKVQSLSDVPITLHAKLFLTAEAIPKIPSGAITETTSQAWRASVQLQEHAHTSPMHLSPGSSANLAFPPVVWQPEQPNHSWKQMLVCLTLAEGKVENPLTDPTGAQSLCQWFAIEPRVQQRVHDIAWQLTFDSNHRTLSVDAKWQSDPSLLTKPVAVEVSIREKPNAYSMWGSLPQIASGTFHLPANQQGMHRVWSLGQCHTSKAIVRIDIDQCPSSLVYEVDLQTTGPLQPSQQLQAIDLEVRDTTILRTASHVDVTALPIMTTSTFRTTNDRLAIGWDSNGDRNLENEEAVELSTPTSIQFLWNGIDPQGKVLVQSIVSHPTFSLPVHPSWNRHAALLATYRSGSQSTTFSGPTRAFDRQPPRIQKIRFQPDPATGAFAPLLGKPLHIEIEIDDGSLSGIASVECGWSLRGELEFQESMVVLSGVARDPQHWVLTVPTEHLPSGSTPLLIRATDRAGNGSPTYVQNIELFTAQAWAAREASRTTMVHGTVTFVQQPLEGIQIAIYQALQEAKDPASNSSSAIASDSKDAPLPPIASTKSNAVGEFVLPEIPSGTYVLRASGIVRGMRVQRDIPLQVNVNIPPTKHFIRMDKSS